MHNTKLIHKLSFLLDTGTIDDCRAHLINNGITVSEDEVTIEWQGTGPGANVSPPLGFECRIRDVTKYKQCMFVEESSCPLDSEYSLKLYFFTLHCRHKSSLYTNFWIEQWTLHH